MLLIRRISGFKGSHYRSDEERLEIEIFRRSGGVLEQNDRRSISENIRGNRGQCLLRVRTPTSISL